MSGFGVPPPLSKDDLAKFFPLTRAAPLDGNTYEIGLTLGGTVSAGAYTAGVLDFLTEALDAWTRAKEDGDPDAPRHKVVISTVAGASGGAINGAILLRTIGWEFPHGPASGNPFYDLWVNGVDLAKLLDPNEPGVTGLSAIFNTASFADLAHNVITTTGKPLGSTTQSPRKRSYYADPLRLFMMVGNVTGVPYRIYFRGQSRLGHDMSLHADFMRFGLTVPGGIANPPGVRPDEMALVCASDLNWDIVEEAALATCAFPAAFRSRPLKRALEMLGYRVAVVPGETPGTEEILQLRPVWDAMGEDGTTPNLYRTVNVDGGTFNNEPLDYARMSLAGYGGRNPRGGGEADRGVILVDPFSDPEGITLFDPPDFFGLLGPLINALVSQARFKPEDLALATDYDTYSRFLVAPVGPGPDGVIGSGCKKIASGGLGGFLGFVDRKFLDYDFRLGRRNAYEFLRDEFVLPSTNPLFLGGTWTPDQLTKFSNADTSPVTGETQDFLPIIPLMKSVPVPPLMTAADWPKLNSAPSDLPNQVSARLDALYAALKSSAKNSWWPGGLGGIAADTAWKLFLRGILRDAFVKTVTKGLSDQKLL